MHAGIPYTAAKATGMLVEVTAKIVPRGDESREEIVELSTAFYDCVEKAVANEGGNPYGVADCTRDGSDSSDGRCTRLISCVYAAPRQRQARRQIWEAVVTSLPPVLKGFGLQESEAGVAGAPGTFHLTIWEPAPGCKTEMDQDVSMDMDMGFME